MALDGGWRVVAPESAVHLKSGPLLGGPHGRPAGGADFRVEAWSQRDCARSGRPSERRAAIRDGARGRVEAGADRRRAVARERRYPARVEPWQCDIDPLGGVRPQECATRDGRTGHDFRVSGDDMPIVRTRCIHAGPCHVQQSIHAAGRPLGQRRELKQSATAAPPEDRRRATLLDCEYGAAIRLTTAESVLIVPAPNANS